MLIARFYCTIDYTGMGIDKWLVPILSERTLLNSVFLSRSIRLANLP
jgi:hypothetical protein